MRFFKLHSHILQNHCASNTYVKTDDDLTNQEIIIIGKNEVRPWSLREEKPEKLNILDYDEINPKQFWDAYDTHFLTFDQC
jgi:hypothetical protein